MNTYKFFLLTIFFCLPAAVSGQILDCEVSLNDDQLEGANLEFLEDLGPQIENYINEYEWTDIDIAEEERIQCQLQIVFTSSDQAATTFSAEAIFSARRPIYNTTANTTTFIINDDSWQFSYNQGKTLIHDELQFESITGFIDFYVYTMLGYDFDSFSELGGDPYFNEAQNILNLAQTSSSVGWSRQTNNRRNRNVLITNLTNPNYVPLRKAIYNYHRKGLDTFVDDPEASRQVILQSLKDIRDAKRRSTNNYLYDLFFDTKAREIASIFQDASTEVRLEAYNVLTEVDQGHLTEYQKLQ